MAIANQVPIFVPFEVNGHLAFIGKCGALCVSSHFDTNKLLHIKN
jgi:hypothetical protein